MFRNLNAIEIAEGALLADIAVIFQFIAAFIPIGSTFFRLLIFVVFTVLVLRRGIYVAIMGMGVAIFLISIVIGPQYMLAMFTEGSAGIFLGVTMKWRLPHIPLILLGALSGAIFAFVGIVVTTLFSGLTVSEIVQGLHRGYNAIMPVLGLLATRLGLGSLWRQQLYPQLLSISSIAFTYWWITLYILLVLFMTPVVGLIYITTNSLVRLLGYDVRPFPGGHLGRLLQRMSRRLLRLTMRRRIVRRLWTRT